MYWQAYDLSDARLHAAIKCILVNRSADGQIALPPVIRIFPETDISIFIDFKGKFTNGNSTFKTAINGIQSKYYYLANTELNYSDKMMIVFQPGGLRYFTKVPISEFKNQLMATDEINDFIKNNIFQQMAEFESTSDRISFFESRLVQLIKFPPQSISLSLFIARNITRKGRLLSAEELNQCTSLGLRQIQRNFLNDIGVNMKLFLKISRFQNSKHILLHNVHNFLLKAWYDSGYYDQPQFNKDFKLLSGLTPVEFSNANNICTINVPDMKNFL